jgi:YesN/AraC family two-component response regulator
MKGEFKVKRLSNSNFDFLFFSNQYYLYPDANIADFALKLNHPVSEINSFIEGRFNKGFIPLITEHRVAHFKNLLESKMHERFTIEALSEMSGFGNRQSMYNAFKKHVGCSPTEFINSL